LFLASPASQYPAGDPAQSYDFLVELTVSLLLLATMFRKADAGADLALYALH